MKELRKIIKEEIKHEAYILKQTKPLSRKLRSLWDKGLKDSDDYKILKDKLISLNALIRFPYQPRYMYLAYAKVRGKDWKILEKYPEKISEKLIDLSIEFYIKKMSSKITIEVSNEK